MEKSLANDVSERTFPDGGKLFQLFENGNLFCK